MSEMFNNYLTTIMFPGIQAHYREGSVFVKSPSSDVHFMPGLRASNATAHGYFNETLNKTGWGILEISSGYSSAQYSNDDIMYAAGYLEGVLTAEYVNLTSLQKVIGFSYISVIT